MYYEGTEVPQDYKKAAHWFRKAAEQGYSVAQHNLGVMYNNGQGIPQDYKEAIVWYSKAAAQGKSSSQHNLSVIYGKGEGVPQDYVKAYMWAKLAASGGDKQSARWRDSIKSKMAPDQIADGERRAAAFVARPTSGPAR